MPRGPEGGVVGRPAIDPQNPRRLYAGAAGQVFQTTDAAGHWNLLGRFPAVLAVDPQNPNILYASGPSKSTDGGLTWNAIGSLPTGCGNPAFVIDPINPSTLYAGCAGVFKSTDGGATWRAASSGLPVGAAQSSVGINVLLIDPNHPSTLYAASDFHAAPDATLAGGGVFKTTDGGTSWGQVWSPADSGLPDYRPLASLGIDPQNPDTLYAVSMGVVARSSDGGGSWTVVGGVPGSFDLHGLVVDPQDSGALYGFSNRGVEKSTDGGATWNAVLAATADPGAWVAVASAAGGPSTVYAGGGWPGVFKSMDGGATWVTANSGLIATSIDALAIDPLNPAIVYAGVNGAGIFRTTNGAASWSTTPSLNVFYAIAVDARNEGTVYAWDGEGIRKSTDGGQNWVSLSLPADDAGGLAIDARDPSALYYCYETGQAFRSTDGGAQWSGLPGFISALATDPQISGTVYAGSVAGTASGQAAAMSSGVLKSVDGGQSWSGVNTLWPRVSVSAIVVDPSDSSVVYAHTGYLDCAEYSCGANDYTDPVVLAAIGLYRSSDGGATWLKLDVAGDANPRLLGIDRQGALYVWVWSQKQFARSRDGGATWSTLSTNGLPDQIMNLAIDPVNSNHLFAGTYGSGLFEIRLGPE
jgi:hypothetical protein